MDGAESRKIDRKHVLLNATIISAEGTQLARIKDLSANGVRISCGRPLTEHSDVIFERDTIFVAARVAWTSKTVAGLEFYRQLNASELDA